MTIEIGEARFELHRPPEGWLHSHQMPFRRQNGGRGGAHPGRRDLRGRRRRAAGRPRAAGDPLPHAARDPTAARPRPPRHVPRDHHGLYHAAVTTGMRLGELVALRWRDVDWNAGRIRVRRNYTCGEFGTPKTRRSTRSIPMIPDLAATLRAHHERTCWTGPTTSSSPTPEPATSSPKPTSPATCPHLQSRRHHRAPPLPRPPPHLRHPHGRRRRVSADVAGVDGASRPDHDPAVRGLRAERARGRRWWRRRLAATSDRSIRGTAAGRRTDFRL